MVSDGTCEDKELCLVTGHSNNKHDVSVRLGNQNEPK